MGHLSRASGADGERLVRDLFRAAGYNAERGCQRDGRTGHADVEGVPHLHIEVKFYSTVTKGLIRNAMEQADRDTAGGGKDLLPVVIHKKKGAHNWDVSMRLETLTELLGVSPFSTDSPLEEIVTMEWEDFINLFKHYEEWRQA